MAFNIFELERGQSIWENLVDINLTESGVHPLSLVELGQLGLDLDALVRMPLAYIQTNGTIALREAIAAHYPGTTADNVEVTNGTSEANYVLGHALFERPGELLIQTPNYLQVGGLVANLGMKVRTFSLRSEKAWETNWDEFDSGLNSNTRAIYISNPNNPTGAVLSEEAMNRLVRSAAKVGAYVIADEIYQGAEWGDTITPSFWGRGDNVIVTSGLSKAYGLPGLRIGWVVGPRELVDRCWAHHDYTSIGPGTLSDYIAQFAVQPANRRKLFEHGRAHIGANREGFEKWIASFGGFLEFTPPAAGAFAFVKYNSPAPSIPMTTTWREKHGVFVVPGAWMGMEGHLRFGLGGLREPFERGLALITPDIRALQGGG